MWSAYEQLCELGANLEASRFFGAANYFNCTGPTDEGDDEIDSRPEFSGRTARSDLQFDDEGEFYREDNNAEDRSTDGAFATPEPPPHLGLATSKSAPNSSSVARPLAYKTPNVNSNNGSSVHTATLVKKPRVAEVIGAPARQRKTHRRPLAGSDEKNRTHARLSFSTAGFDESPLVGAIATEDCNQTDWLTSALFSVDFLCVESIEINFRLANISFVHPTFLSRENTDRWLFP
ncbi:unnamed protein product [Phytophthora fragariaefolia]|uniref:Unnamed protein product n=1 Tax=Phytophthora fragariaefolia TaxID=1490495 RepID=A0A9W6U6K6_9STRA|nr:unnamed protein product [Phytophthora fragariaefolia]